MMRKSLLFLILSAGTGCGSGEDFSKPPAAIQQRQTNAKPSSAPTAEGTPAAATPEGGSAATAHAAATDANLADMTAGGETTSTTGDSEPGENGFVSSPENPSTAPATPESATADPVASMSNSGASGLVSATVAANAAPTSESSSPSFRHAGHCPQSKP